MFGRTFDDSSCYGNEAAMDLNVLYPPASCCLPCNTFDANLLSQAALSLAFLCAVFICKHVFSQPVARGATTY